MEIMLWELDQKYPTCLYASASAKYRYIICIWRTACYYKKQLEVSPCLPFPADHLCIHLLFFHGRLKNTLKKLLTDNYTYTHTHISEKYHSLSLHLELKIIVLYVTLKFIFSTMLVICFHFTEYPKRQFLCWECYENCNFFSPFHTCCWEFTLQDKWGKKPTSYLPR